MKLSSLTPKQIQYTAMVIDWSDLLSSKQLQMLESSIRHGWASLDSYGLGTILAPIAPNSSCKLPASEDSTKILQKQWWIIDELIKKVNVKMEKKWENFWGFGLDLKKWLLVFNSVRIRLLYMPLIQALIMISTKLDD